MPTRSPARNLPGPRSPRVVRPRTTRSLRLHRYCGIVMAHVHPTPRPNSRNLSAFHCPKHRAVVQTPKSFPRSIAPSTEPWCKPRNIDALPSILSRPQVGAGSPTFGPACNGFQEHAAIIDAVKILAPTWRLEDIIMLIHCNHLFISDPDKCPIEKAKWAGKSCAAVNRLLHKIRTNDDHNLRRAFPVDPMVWTPADEQDVAEAQQVSVWGGCDLLPVQLQTLLPALSFKLPRPRPTTHAQSLAHAFAQLQLPIPTPSLLPTPMPTLNRTFHIHAHFHDLAHPHRPIPTPTHAHALTPAQPH